MTFLEKVKVIKRIDGLIRRKATGNANDLAKRIGVSRSTVFEILNCMKELGADIRYNEYKNSYYYSNANKLSFGYERLTDSTLTFGSETVRKNQTTK